jgi:hypothetical protein
MSTGPFAKLALAAALILLPAGVSAQASQTMLERTVQNQLVLYGIDDVDASTLTTNQLSGIKATLSSREFSRQDKIRQVNRILARG